MPQSIQKGLRDLMNKGFCQNATEDDSHEAADVEDDIDGAGVNNKK